MLCMMLALLALGAATAAQGVWRNVGPGGGGSVTALLSSSWDRDLIYAGSDVGGFFRSKDGGRCWSVSNDGLVDRFVTAIAESPRQRGLVLLGVRGGIYRSEDGGGTWQRMTVGLPARKSGSYSLDISRFAWSGGGRRLFAAVGHVADATSGRGAVYVSEDAGVSWSNIVAVGSLPADLVVGDMVVHPKDAHRIVVATPDRGLFRTLDGGVTWQPANAGLPLPLRTRHLAQCFTQPNRLYVTLRQKGGETWNAGVYRSDDGGTFWRAVNEGFKQVDGEAGDNDMKTTWTDCLAVNARNPDVVYAGGATWWDTGIYRTTDGGGRWQKVLNTPQDGWLRHWGLSVLSLSESLKYGDVVTFGTPGVVFRSEDAGVTWAARYSGLENTCVHAIVPDPAKQGRFYVCFYDIGLFVTDDGGRTFRRMMNGVPAAFDNSCFNVVLERGGAMYAAFGWWSDRTRTIYARSTDGGENWMPVSDDMVPDALVNPRGGTLPVDAGEIRNVCRLGSAVLVTSRDVAGKSRGGAYLSEDGGTTWEHVYRHHFCEAAYIDGERLYISLFDHQYHDDAGGGGILMSTDRGKNWTKLPALPNECVNCLVRDPFSQKLLVGTAGNGVFIMQPVTTAEAFLHVNQTRDDYWHIAESNPLALTWKRPEVAAQAELQITTGGIGR